MRVPEPLASWRRHSASISLHGGAEHGAELLRLVELGAAALELPTGAVAIRAEALRNACIQAAFRAAGSDASMGERFATIDLTRPGISAFGAGIPRDEMPDERADRVAGLWREVAVLTRRLAEVRTSGRAPKAALRRLAGIGARTGVKVALRRLDRIGALGGEEGTDSAGSDGGDLPLELMEAAIECEPDTDSSTSRFLVIDRRRDKIPDEEFEELNWLGLRASVDQLADVIADRRRKLEAAGERPSTADL